MKPSQDFLLVLAKKEVSFFVTLSLWQLGQEILGFASNSLIERKMVNSLLQSLQMYSYAGITTSSIKN